MRVDHVVYAAEHDGADATAQRLGTQLGVEPVDGGYHPRFGTRNVIIPLLEERYLEVVEVLEHPAADKAPFGQVVRARSESGGGWLGWVLAVADIAPHERRLGREAQPGMRHRPDGVQINWRQLGVRGLQADPQVPFFVQWLETDNHPSQVGPTGSALKRLEIAGDLARFREWLGLAEGEKVSPELGLDFHCPHGTPGIMSVTFSTLRGDVTI